MKRKILVVACGNQKLYEIMCNELLKKPELITDERFTTVPLRVENNEALKAYMEEWTSQLTVDEVEAALAKGIPAGPSFDIGQFVADEHIAGDREMFLEIDHPVIGKMKVNGNPIKMTQTMPSVHKPAPVLGQHNAEVLKDMLGLTQAEVAELVEQGACDVKDSGACRRLPHGNRKIWRYIS